MMVIEPSLCDCSWARRIDRQREQWTMNCFTRIIHLISPSVLLNRLLKKKEREKTREIEKKNFWFLENVWRGFFHWVEKIEASSADPTRELFLVWTASISTLSSSSKCWTEIDDCDSAPNTFQIRNFLTPFFMQHRKSGKYRTSFEEIVEAEKNSSSIHTREF